MGKLIKKLRKNAKRNGANGKSKFNVEREVINRYGKYFDGDKELILNTFNIAKDLTLSFCKISFKNKWIPNSITLGIAIEEDFILHPDFKPMVMNVLDDTLEISSYVKEDITIEKKDDCFEITLSLKNSSSYLEILLFLAFECSIVENMVNTNSMGEQWSNMGIEKTDIINAMISVKQMKYCENNERVLRILNKVLGTPSYDAIVFFTDGNNNVA